MKSKIRSANLITYLISALFISAIGFISCSKQEQFNIENSSNLTQINNLKTKGVPIGLLNKNLTKKELKFLDKLTEKYKIDFFNIDSSIKCKNLKPLDINDSALIEIDLILNSITRVKNKSSEIVHGTSNYSGLKSLAVSRIDEFSIASYTSNIWGFTSSELIINLTYLYDEFNNTVINKISHTTELRDAGGFWGFGDTYVFFAELSQDEVIKYPYDDVSFIYRIYGNIKLGFSIGGFGAGLNVESIDCNGMYLPRW